MQRHLDRAKITEDFVAAAEFLLKPPQSTGKLGAVGFCFGGTMVNRLAVRLPELAAGVPFYGSAPPAAEVPKSKQRCYYISPRKIRGSTPRGQATTKRSR